MLCVCVKMTPLGRGVIILTIQGRVMFLSSILCFIIMRAGVGSIPIKTIATRLSHPLMYCIFPEASYALHGA